MQEKFLILDADKSLSSIGGDTGAKALSGVEPLKITQGMLQIRGFIDQLFTRVIQKTKHPLFIGVVEETVVVPSPLCKEMNLNGIVLDTISHTFRQDMRILEKAQKSGQLEMQDWGKLERLYNEAIMMLVALPTWVIVNCHSDYDKDQSTGMFYYYPGVKGSTKATMIDYFDVVCYTKASRDGKKNYTWQTYADASKFAKDRLGILEGIMPQDFSVIIEAYRSKGIKNPKILVVGESGTGKTRALASLSKLTINQ